MDARDDADPRGSVAEGGAQAAGSQLQARTGARLAAEARVDAHLVKLLGQLEQSRRGLQRVQWHGQVHVLELRELFDHQELFRHHL